MLKDMERKLLIDFLSKYADGDVLIQAANRVSNNLTDIGDLKKFISDYKPNVAPGPEYLKENQVKEENPEEEPIEDFGPIEDLGPVPKKLGRVGQDIHAELRKRGLLTSDAIAKNIKQPVSKVKPQLALLIERGMVARVGSKKYAHVAKE